MAVMSADGLSILVGDGAGSESFNRLKGLSVHRLDISQRNHTSNAVRADAWQQTIGTSGRKAVVDAEAYATDDAAALRLRSLAMSGAVGNFKLGLNGAETIAMAAVVAMYQERIEPGNLKRLQFRLESSGVVV